MGDLTRVVIAGERIYDKDRNENICHSKVVAIAATVRDALDRTGAVITTGGLGPTSDDITRDLIAELVGRKLVFNSEAMRRMENYFASRKRTMPVPSCASSEVTERCSSTVAVTRSRQKSRR